MVKLSLVRQMNRMNLQTLIFRVEKAPANLLQLLAAERRCRAFREKSNRGERMVILFWAVCERIFDHKFHPSLLPDAAQWLRLRVFSSAMQHVIGAPDLLSVQCRKKYVCDLYMRPQI